MADGQRTLAARSRPWDVAMIVLLLASVALVFWYEALDPGADADLRRLLEWTDLALVAFFVVEWAWRVRRSASEGSWRYAVRHSWELLGMVPLLAPFPSFLRFLRLLRIVRILRVFGTLGRRLGFWQRLASQGHLHKIALASGVVTVVGATLVWLLERDAPGAHIDDFETALWWAIVTVTTVGYGDVTPVTVMGRFVATLLMVTGIGTIGLLASSLASVLVKQDAQAEAAGTLGDELATLAELHAQGRLTDDEFRQAKQRVLR